MSRISISSCAAALAALFATALAAQAPQGFEEEGLLYTTLDRQVSRQCQVPPPNAHNDVVPEDVQYIVPPPDGPYTSWLWGPHTGYCELVGDHDANANYWEAPLFGAIDALVRPRDREFNPITLNMRRLFISPRDTIRHAGLGWIFRQGDIGRILPGGALELFISEGQIRTVLGMPTFVTANVDAAAFAFDARIQQWSIFLSFENNTQIWQTASGMTTPVRDGDILRIPMQDLPLVAFSPYDGARLVTGVNPWPNATSIWMPEAVVDVHCATSGVSDNAALPVPQIIDTDGLTSDPHPEHFGHLWFSGEGLDGCSVLSTWGGGTIAVLNGRALGMPIGVPTDGTQVGLVPPAKRGLNGLAQTSAFLCHLTTETTTPMGGGTNVVIEIGGAPPFGPAWLLIGAWADNGLSDPSVVPGVAIDPTCFPDVYPFLVAPPVSPAMVPIGPDGCGLWGAPFPPVPGIHITAQAVAVNPTGGPALLSTPTVIDL